MGCPDASCLLSVSQTVPCRPVASLEEPCPIPPPPAPSPCCFAAAGRIAHRGPLHSQCWSRRRMPVPAGRAPHPAHAPPPGRTPDGTHETYDGGGHLCAVRTAGLAVRRLPGASRLRLAGGCRRPAGANRPCSTICCPTGWSCPCWGPELCYSGPPQGCPARQVACCAGSPAPNIVRFVPFSCPDQPKRPRNGRCEARSTTWPVLGLPRLVPLVLRRSPGVRRRWRRLRCSWSSKTAETSRRKCPTGPRCWPPAWPSSCCSPRWSPPSPGLPIK